MNMALTEEDKIWLATRFDAINDRLDNLANYGRDMRAQVSRRLDVHDHRLDLLGSMTPNIDLQPFTKSMIDVEALVSQLAGAQQISTDRHFDLETRIAKLEEQVAKLTPAA